MPRAEVSPYRACSQAKKDATELQEKSKSMKAEIVRAEEAAKEAEAVRDRAAAAIGNLVHDSVPVSNDEVRPCTMYAAHHTPFLNTIHRLTKPMNECAAYADRQ